MTGKLLLSLNHGEFIRGTAVAFKPARKIDEEGMRVWLGTNLGELQEIDLATKRIVDVNGTAHARREVVKIHRHATELWTIDNEGKLNVWPADDDGSPSLSLSFLNPRLPHGHVTSLVVGDNLWFATAKELRVFKPSSTEQNDEFYMTAQPINHASGAGDISSSAILYGHSDHVYFGHSDGKITYYSQKEFTCLGMVVASMYKISCLVGAGRYLWAGNYTGTLCVYDTGRDVWKLKKDWKAHDTPIAGLIADRSSIWKLGRLQVLSLAVDNTIKLWDGMLETDWFGKPRASAQVSWVALTKSRR